MSLPSNIRDRDHRAYELARGESARRVKVVNESGDSIPVFITEQAGIDPILVRGSLSALAVGASADVLTYVVPAEKELSQISLLISSTNVSEVNVSLDAVVVATIYLSWFNFNQQILLRLKSYAAGTELKVTATNNGKSTGDYSCTLEGALSES